jgi:hypothetical protein
MHSTGSLPSHFKITHDDDDDDDDGGGGGDDDDSADTPLLTQ